MSTSWRTGGIEFTHGAPLGGPSYTPQRPLTWHNSRQAGYRVLPTENCGSVRTHVPMNADWGRSAMFPYREHGHYRILDDAHVQQHSEFMHQFAPRTFIAPF